MALLLCHECYFWVPARAGRCPECDHTVDSTIPDPPADVLDRLIGVALRPLGTVRLSRRSLPERGTLYETMNGLFFVPHHQHRRVEIVEKSQHGRSLLWMLASIAFTPLMLVLPFLRFRKLTAEEVPVFEPVFLTDDQRQRLGQVLMENPGVFYIPRDSILRVHRRRRRWLIERRIGSTLRLIPETDFREFDHQLTGLLTREPWQAVADA